MAERRSTPQERFERTVATGWPAQAAGIALTVVFFLITGNGWFLALGAIVVVLLAANTLIVRPLVRRDMQAAVLVELAVAATAAVALTAIIPLGVPIFVGAIFLGVVYALPYLDRTKLRWVLVATGLMSGALAVLGELQNWTGMDHRVHWIKWPVMCAIPIPVVFAAIALRDYRNNLTDSNVALQRSQDLVLAQANELRQSRQRVVEVADEERRRIERDLHDGAQQRLLGLLLGLRSTRALLATDPEAGSHRLTELEKEVQATLTEIRELAHGIYPPALTARGVVAALTSLSERMPIPTTVESQLTSRVPEPMEVAIYFGCLEALQNTIKHGGEEVEATVRIWDDGSNVYFSVTDTGPGFAVAPLPDKGGLANIRDRLGAVGGTIEFPAFTSGATVRGVIPLNPMSYDPRTA
jgi:signal transduction histidine kinase